MELLTLFADKGVAIQNVAISDHHAKVSIASGSRIFLLLFELDGKYDRTTRIATIAHRCTPQS